MGLRIYNNVEAQNAHRQLSANSYSMSKTMEHLSSGLRINRAGDDAAGLAVSESMRTQIRGLNVAARNSLDGVSLIQVADGAMNGVNDLLQRMRELAVQSANGTYSNQQRAFLDAEVQQLITEVSRVASDTDFNGLKILAGCLAASGMTLQVGADAGQQIGFTLPTLDATNLTINAIAISTAASAASAIASIDAAINNVNGIRAKLGAIQNRLEQTITRVRLTAENIQAAESRIRDADMAQEMVDLTRRQILDQSGMAMLAQANQANQGVLRLLQG